MQVPTDGPDSEVQRDDSLSSSPCEFMLRLDQDLQDLGFPGLYEKEAAPASRKRKKLEKTSKEKTKAENRAANTLRYHTHPLKCHVCAGNMYSDQLEAELPDWLKDIDLGDSEMEELVCVCLGSCCVCWFAHWRRIGQIRIPRGCLRSSSAPPVRHKRHKLNQH